MRVAPASIMACGVLQRAHAAGGLDAQVRAHGGRIRATSAAVAPPPLKPVEVLTKSAPASTAASQARTFSASLSRDVSMMTFRSESVSVDRLGHGRDVVDQGPLVQRAGSGDVDHHVDLVGAVQRGAAGLKNLDVGVARAQREADHGAGQHAGALEGLVDGLDPDRVHADGLEVVLRGLRQTLRMSASLASGLSSVWSM